MKNVFSMGLALFFLCLTPARSQSVDSAPAVVSTGVVIPSRKVTLAAKIMGRIETIHHQEGEAVKRGEILLSLDSAELDAELASAQASLELAGTELEYKRKLESRVKRLAASKSVSQDRVDDALFGALSAEDRVQVAKAQVSKVRAMLRETRIVAPFDGVITHKKGEIGQMTQPGEPLFVLEDQSRLKFKTTVKEQDVPRIAIGEPAAIIVSALGDLKLEGKVSRIIPSGDPITHAFIVEIALPEQEGLYPGMFGKAEFLE